MVLANLAGFDGSPESMRQWQLEYGAEIGRAIVNFRGPIVFCVISRYHGGAFVVFSQRLNEGFEAIAVEGAHASVIGGSAAAGVVFTRDVNAATRSDPRVVSLEERIEDCSDAAETRRLRAELASTLETVRSEKMGELAAKFDSIHSIQRAVEVGSVNGIVAAGDLRPYLVEAIERGMARTEAETRDVITAARRRVQSPGELLEQTVEQLPPGDREDLALVADLPQAVVAAVDPRDLAAAELVLGLALAPHRDDAARGHHLAHDALKILVEGLGRGAEGRAAREWAIVEAVNSTSRSKRSSAGNSSSVQIAFASSRRRCSRASSGRTAKRVCLTSSSNACVTSTTSAGASARVSITVSDERSDSSPSSS